MAEKKRKTWLWVLGWIFCFPIPLTILMLRNKKLSNALRFGVIVFAWLLVLSIALFGGKSPKKEEAPADEPTKQEQVAKEDKIDKPAKKEADEEPPSEEDSATTALTIDIVGGEANEYSRSITLNANTDMPDERVVYFVPAGTYDVTNTASHPDQFNIYTEETHVTEEGWEEVVDADSRLLKAGDTETFEVPEGWYVYVTPGSTFTMVQK